MSGPSSIQAGSSSSAPSSDFSPDQSIVAGIEEDVDMIISKTVNLFDANASLDFQYFLAVWREVKVGLIFCGRDSYRETYEFTESLFSEIKKRLHESEPLAVKAAALFLLYALYFKQPILPPIRIRLTFEQTKTMMAFIGERVKQEHWELVHVWNTLVKEKAFHFCVTEQPMGVELGLSYELTKGSSDGRKDRHENPLKSEDFQSSLAQIESLHRKYENIKSALNTIETDDHSNLCRSDSNFIQSIQDSINISDRTAAKKTQGNVLVEAKTGTTIGQRRKAILNRAFEFEAKSPRKKSKKSD